MKVWVVGASNVDIIARSDAPVIAADSNVGTVEKAPGGVGRNIAFALNALGFDVSMLTAIADDEYGHMIADGMEKAGIKLCIAPFSGKQYRTGVYCCIMDGDGSLVCAVNDMMINEKISPELIAEHKDVMEACDYVVFDANLAPETIKAITATDTRLVADCVSSIKAPKLNDVLERELALKTIWIDDNYFNARSMDVYITKLRKHLKDDPNIEINNVHGKGYRLIVPNMKEE